ncbi:MAG: chaperone NapD [Cocleimonas sp.]|nr:chaperone NapD [Cocleimonas sp.]
MMTLTEVSPEVEGNENYLKVNTKEENVISICGVTVFILPENRAEVEARMLEIPGLEIHGASDEGKLVVTIETPSYRGTGDAVTQLQKLEGILSIAMIYQHAEALDEESLNDEKQIGNANTTQLENNPESK